MRIDPEISGMGVVTVGDFSPAVFTPAWFSLYNLLPRNAVDSLNVQIVSSEVTAFSYEWLRVEATRNHLVITTLQEPYVRLRDVVIRMFREQFSNAPVNALGINRTVHFRVRNFEERDRIGRALAPVDAWGVWGRDLERDSSRGGMTSLTMTQANIKERSKDDRFNVQVEPSNRVGGGVSGVYVEVNDHYALGDSTLRSGEKLAEILEMRFDLSREQSDRVIDHVMSLAEKKD